MTSVTPGSSLGTLPRQIVAGLVVGAMGVSLALSLATLIFTGDLAPELGRGVGWALAGMVLLGSITALTSSFHGLVAGPQDAPAVILAAAAAGIVTGTDEPLATLATFIILTTALTGVLLLAMGRFRLGDLVRYVPYPVVAGFLGGTGVVLVTAGVRLLFGETGGAGELGLRIVPGLVLGVVLASLGRQGMSPTASVLAIAGGFVGYHLAAAVAGVAKAEGIARGLLLGPFPEGRLADPGVITELASADWGAVLGQAPAIVAMAMIVPLALLLNTGGLEPTYRLDLDIDRELMATGAGLIASAPFAGLPGYVYLSVTIMGRRFGGASRIPPLIGAAVGAVVLLIGADLVSLMPVIIPAGLLVAIGLDLILSWVWDVRHRVTRLEHLVILGIVVTIGLFGFLPGVGLGLVAATVLFVVRYSRTPAVRTMCTARDRRSNVQRGAADDAALTEVGGRVALIELQGYLFFGTTEQIVRSARRSLEARPEVELLLIDLRRVTGMDSSAVASFERLVRFAETHQLRLVFCGAPPEVAALLAPTLTHELVGYQVDLDHALEVAEGVLLGHRASPHRADEAMAWDDVPAVDLAAGSPVITEGARGAGLFYLESGRASVASPDPDARRAVLLPGAVIGELSHLSGEPAMATVVCDTDCVVRHLSPGWLDELAQRDPLRALAIERLIARRLAAKLNAANRTIRSLQ